MESPFFEALGTWLQSLTALSLSAQTQSAYRRDLIGVAGRIAPNAQITALHVSDLTLEAMRAGFVSWAADHGSPSVARAHSAWNGFFHFLLAHEAATTNPMPTIPKPRTTAVKTQSINNRALATRLLSVARQPDPRAQVAWTERDHALVTMYSVGGIGDRAMVSLNLGDVGGTPGARHLRLAGKRGTTWALQLDASFEPILDRYLASRAERFAGTEFARRDSALFLDRHGRRMSDGQVKYLITRIYDRSGAGAPVSAGALVKALRHSFATEAATTSTTPAMRQAAGNGNGRGASSETAAPHREVTPQRQRVG